jgi:hypothetical protein
MPEEIMTTSAPDEAGDYNTEIINEFRANQGRVGGMWEGTTLITSELTPGSLSRSVPRHSRSWRTNWTPPPGQSCGPS